jgi:hypothetical protein
MIYQLESHTVETLFLEKTTEITKNRIKKSLGIPSSEKAILGWNLHRWKKSSMAFLVSDRKIYIGSKINGYGVPSSIDLSDIVDVKFDGIFCFNIFTKSKQPNALSIPANYFFSKVSYALLSIEQKSLLFYIARIIKLMI